MDSGGLLDILSHPNQRILIVNCDSYAYLVPYVEDEDCYVLKTVIPSRKAIRDYLKRDEQDAED